MRGKGKKSNHERIGALFSKMLDDPMTIGLHTGYLKMLGGDSNTAILLAQIVFWSDKGSSDGSFYKSTPEWVSELGMSRYKIDRSRKILQDMGVISVTVEMASGSMTNHYRLNVERLHELIAGFASIKETTCEKLTGEKLTGEKLADDLRETYRSPARNLQVPPARNLHATCEKLTGLYTENTTENTNRDNQRAHRDGARDLDFDLTGFDELWSAYPNKAAKTRAQTAWIDLAPDEELQATMIKAVKAQRSSPQWDEPRYIPHLASWINDRRWEDEIDDGRYREPDDSEYGGDLAKLMATVRAAKGGRN